MDVQQSPTPYQTDVNGVPVIATPPSWSLHQLTNLAAHAFVQLPSQITGEQLVQNNESFAYYNHRFASDATLYTVSRENRRVTARLDYHAGSNKPSHNAHLLVREFSFSKRFQAWRESNKRNFSQIDFAHFLEDRIRDLSTAEHAPASQGSLLSAVLQFKATQSGVCNSATNLMNGDVEFTFSNNTNITSTQLPQSLLLSLDVFEFGRYWDIPARLKFRLKDGVLTFWYELIRIEEFLDEVFAQEVESLRMMLNGGDAAGVTFVLED